jgi:MOSC domain-containing protein YiiM
LYREEEKVKSGSVQATVVSRPVATRSRTGWGCVEAIHIARQARAPMVAIGEALLVAGRGIEGDRYFLRSGTFSEWPADHELTLVEAEAIEAVAREYGLQLGYGETRRNITTRGLKLNDLVGVQFRVGDALCQGTRLCHPCAHLEVVTGLGGLARLLAERGGLRAHILVGGRCAVGDAICTAGKS